MAVNVSSGERKFNQLNTFLVDSAYLRKTIFFIVGFIYFIPSDKSGMWTGVSPLGKVGKFECTKTSAAGGGPGPTSPTREKKGSKAKRAKSGKSKEVKKR